MKTIFKKVAFVFVLMFMAAAQTAKAESTVYFFVDFRFWNSEYIFTLNGEKAFSLVPEGKAVSAFLGASPGAVAGMSAAVTALCFFGSLTGVLISRELKKSGVMKK